ALEQMSAAHPVLEASSVVNAAIGELDLAEVLREAGLTTEAERTLERVARTLGAHGMRQARGEAEFNLARSLLMHDPARAATVARAAARRFRALGSTSWAARALALQLRAELGQPPSSPVTGLASGTTRVPSRARVEAAAADLDRLGFGSEATALRLSQQLWQARHERTVRGSGRSTDEVAEPVVRVPRDAPIQLRLLADEVRAARAGTAGRYAQARQRAARGLDTLAAWQRSFGSIDLQTSITMHATGLVTEGLAAAVASGRPEVLFEWSERARHLSQQVVPLRPPPDPELAADLAELRALRADNPSGWLADPRTAALQDRARRRQWSTTGVAGVNDQVTLDALQGGLGADTALLAYVATADGLSCLAVTADSARLFRLTAWPRLLTALTGLRADLDVSASVRSGPMAAVVARTLGERLADLEGVLLRNPLAAVGDRRIVLTAPGELAGLPWTLLPGLRGRPFTLAASATRWVHDRTQAGRPGVGFAAGPGVARGDEEVETGVLAWTGVPAASAAAPRVVPQVLRGPAATVDAVAALASRVGVLHVAAHGRHAVDNPLFSGLELADGALFGYDIDRIGQVPQTVVLSACEVGRSAVRWGEEAIGMTRTWLHAGTSCVVAAPVAVADDAACELLGAMHTGLATGLAPAEALARAAGRTGVLAPFQCHGSGF
ncbi:MAG: CHAT domain-containing protein, partial [Propionicimonas sp.]|nr:CHAT domain-containing protein [Propionicimonas sp.]